MYTNIVNGPGQWDLVIGANHPGEHGRKEVVEFTFIDNHLAATRKVKFHVLFGGSRRHGSMDLFLRALEDLGDESDPQSIYHYVYDPRSRRGALQDVDFAKYAKKRAEGRDL
ncbi:MAG TPA: hypothetical protein VMR75_03895 [Candidatus Saccharimonadales bacterium]|nr:hypothetical protein [Candidatus Saccharimonadales bacterium]